jgi:hypothetical protein
MDRVIRTVITVLVAGVTLLAVAALNGIFVMLLWNLLFANPESIIATQLPELDFWHAWMLTTLCNILFKSTSKS